MYNLRVIADRYTNVMHADVDMTKRTIFFNDNIYFKSKTAGFFYEISMHVHGVKKNLSIRQTRHFTIRSEEIICAKKNPQHQWNGIYNSYSFTNSRTKQDRAGW